MKGDPFEIFGTPVEEHIKSLWEKHDARREQEKLKKHQEKGTNDPKHCILKGATPAKISIP